MIISVMRAVRDVIYKNVGTIQHNTALNQRYNAIKGLSSYSSNTPAISQIHNASNAHKSNVIVYRCVNLIASNIAAIPVFARKQSDDTVVQCKFCSQPNPQVSYNKFMRNLVSYLFLHGHVFIACLGEYEYYILPARHVGGTEQNWHYNGPATNMAWRRAKIHKLSLHDTTSPFHNLTPTKVSEKALHLYASLNEWHRSILANTTLISAVIKVKGVQGHADLNSDASNALMEKIRSLHAGASNAGEPFLCDSDIECKPLSSTKDLDFSSCKADVASEIAYAFGVPPILLGIMTATYNNYEQARLQFWNDTLIPLAKSIIQDIECFVVKEDMKLQLDLSHTPGSKNLELLKSILPVVAASDVLTEKERALVIKRALRDALGITL